MSGLAGAGNKTRNYQQQKQLQYLLDTKPNYALDTKYLSQTNL